MPEGRPPKPAVLKILEGNPGQRPIKPEPRPTPKPPAKPRGMSEEARRVWNRLVPELDRVFVLTRVDGETLHAFCEACATHREATKDIQERGLIVDEKANPSARIQTQAAATIRQIASEYGLTPYSRSRLSSPELPEEEANDLLTPKRDTG